MISKYIDHLPLYRQRQQFLRMGVDIPESTLCGWFKRSTQLLSPLVDRLKAQVLSADYLQADWQIVHRTDWHRNSRQAG